MVGIFPSLFEMSLVDLLDYSECAKRDIWNIFAFLQHETKKTFGSPLL